MPMTFSTEGPYALIKIHGMSRTHFGTWHQFMVDNSIYALSTSGDGRGGWSGFVPADKADACTAFLVRTRQHAPSITKET